MTVSIHKEDQKLLSRKACCSVKTNSIIKTGCKTKTGCILKTGISTKAGNLFKACCSTKASFTVEAALLMTVILPILLALLYYGFFLHDRGVLNGAAQEITARADLNNWKASGNNRLAKLARSYEGRTGPSRQVSSSVQVSRSSVSAKYKGAMSLPGLLPSLFKKSSLNTGAGAKRTLLYPADLIRKIRGLEYVSKLLNKKQ